MESSRKLIILLVAGVIVAFAAIAIRNRMASEPAAPQAISDRVIIAKHDIAPGTLVQMGADIDWGEVPKERLEAVAREENKDAPAQPADAPPKDPFLREGIVKLEEFNGAVARRQLRTGDPIVQTAMTRPGEGGFMAAVLEPGMRAVSIAVNATSGNAGFISPGDSVDLIVTHRIKSSKSGGGGEDTVVSETFVHDVRVLAVDQMLDNPENKAILAKTVTVEVNGRQAEQISVAQEMGKISMALRSTAAAQPAPATAADVYGNYTRDKDISQMLDRKDFSPRIRVIRGDESETVEFY